MFATETPSNDNESSAVGGRSRGHDGRQSHKLLVRVDDPRGLRWPAGRDAQRVPPTAVTPDPSGRSPRRPGVTRPLAFFIGRGADGHSSGCRRAWLHPPASGAGPRWFKSSHPDCKRKGKPTGDGIRLEPGRATSLEGSTPSPSAANEVPVAERPRRRSSKPDRRVRLPPGTLTDGSLTRRRTTWPGRQPADHPSSELGMLGVQLPPGPLHECPGGPARSGRHVLTVENMGSNPIQGTDQTCRLGTGEPKWL
jgi:hypothetical protein